MISEYDLTILRDDRGFFPSYLLTPVVRQTILERHPEIKPILEKLSAELDNATIVALNAAADLHGRFIEEVASEFLRDRALLSAP
jgi:osmoprotectant transport system substrate-binding protein